MLTIKEKKAAYDVVYRRQHKEKGRIAQKKWYTKNRDKVITYKKKYYAENKTMLSLKRKLYYQTHKKQEAAYHKKSLEAFVKYKRTLRCKRCGLVGKKFPFLLDFHHRNPVNKKFSISIKGRLFPAKKVLDEIAKCDVYCSNCHRIIHHTEGRT